MFELAPLGLSIRVRTGPAQWWAEVVASFGLVGVILGGLRFAVPAIAWLGGLSMTAAYGFTASASVANPAVAIARAFTDTFSGIRPWDVPGSVAARCAGQPPGDDAVRPASQPRHPPQIRGALRDEAR